MQHVFDVMGKENGVLDTDRGALRDLSGGALAQTLSDFLPLASDVMRAVTPSSGFDSPSKREFESLVLQRTFPDGGALWASSGSDGIEAGLWALDVERRERGLSERPTYWVRRGGYHGNTYLARALSSRQVQAQPVDVHVGVIDENDVREAYSAVFPEPPGRSFLARLEDAAKSERLRRGDVVVLETWPTTGHYFYYPDSFWSQLFAFCKRHELLCLLDEVAGGAFRHGTFSLADRLGRSQVEGSPDVVVLSKGLSSGSYPMSVAVVSAPIAENIRARPAKPISFTHGLTEPAARLGLYTYCRHDGRASQDRRDRARQVDGVARELKSDCIGKGVGVEWSPTTLRCNMSEAQATRLLESLSRDGLWCYIGRSVLRSGDGEGVRAFAHVCPGLDWDPKESRAALSSFERALRESVLES